MELPEYKKYVADKLNSLLEEAAPYTGPKSPLQADLAGTLGNRLEKAKNECQQRLEKFRPKIMLFGVYNSGKSTLLNALLGAEVAEMGDIPKTCQVASYEWKDHEVLDTPGIDAPVEHERISREALRSSQIVAFVISSSGSFENRKIYEAMKDVVDMGKRLIIILNVKDGDFSKSDLAEIKDRIQKILEQEGFSRKEAASFRLTQVNALDALEGRLANEEEMIAYSGIRDVEELFYEELKQQNGYAYIKDSLAYLLDEYKFFFESLEETLKGNDKTQDQAFLDLREHYHNFRSGLEEYIDTECASLASEIYHCFPPIGTEYNMDAIKSSIEVVLQNCLNAVNGKIQIECEKFQDILLRQGSKILQSSEESLHAQTEIDNLEELVATLTSYQKEGEPGKMPEYTPDKDFVDKLGDTATLLSTIPLTKLPIPLPIPPVLIPAILVGIKIIASLFGKSSAEKESERQRAQINHEREMAERQARAQERQREEIKMYGNDIKIKFMRDLKIAVRENMDKRFKPVLDALEGQCNTSKDLDASIRQQISRIYENMREIKNTMAELR